MDLLYALIVSSECGNKQALFTTILQYIMAAVAWN